MGGYFSTNGAEVDAGEGVGIAFFWGFGGGSRVGGYGEGVDCVRDREQGKEVGEWMVHNWTSLQYSPFFSLWSYYLISKRMSVTLRSSYLFNCSLVVSSSTLQPTNAHTSQRRRTNKVPATNGMSAAEEPSR